MSKTFTTAEIMEKVAQGKAFTLLLFFSGHPVPDDDLLVNQMQLAHLAHLFHMENEGRCCIYGPVSNHPELYGLVIFNSTDREEIQQWMADDPYVREGYLTYELY